MRSLRSIVPIISLMGAAPSFAQVKMNMFANGEKLGTAVFRYDQDRSGRLTERIEGKLNYKGAWQNQLEVDVCDRAGRPIRVESGSQQKGKSELAISTYEAKRVRVTKTVNGKRTERVIAIPKGNIADASSLWFVTVRPKPGATTTFLHLDTDKMAWTTQKARYVGYETVPGMSVKGHHVHGPDVEMWLDEKGYPFRMEHSEGSIKMMLVRQ